MAYAIPLKLTAPPGASKPFDANGEVQVTASVSAGGDGRGGRWAGLLLLVLSETVLVLLLEFLRLGS